MILSLRGLGSDCPAFAPYRLPAERGGGCSNVPPESEGAGAPPAGAIQNPVTGVYETVYVDPSRDMNEVLYAPGAGESSRAAAEAEQAEAVRQARERGIPISCQIRTNSAPGVPAIFWSECSVGGDPGHDAGLLIRPGGWNIATAAVNTATNQNLSPGSAPPVIPPGQQAAASAATGRPNQSVPPADTSVPMKTGVPNTGSAMSAAQAGAAPAPSPAVGADWTWLLLAAGAALFFMRGK